MKQIPTELVLFLGFLRRAGWPPSGISGIGLESALEPPAETLEFLVDVILGLLRAVASDECIHRLTLVIGHHGRVIVYAIGIAEILVHGTIHLGKANSGLQKR